MSTSSEEFRKRAILQMVAGACSGAITKTSTAPLERLKILFQIQGMNPTMPAKYTSIPQSFVVIFKEEGIKGFYKGNGANVLRVMPVYALKFTFNDVFKDLVRKGKGSDAPLTFMELMQSGTLAGLFQQAVTFPLEFIRTRLSFGAANQAVAYKGIMDCVRQTIKSEGFFGFYKGFAMTIISGAPYVGLQMTAYELLRRQVLQHTEKADINWWQKLGCGAMAGLFAQTVTFPGDTIRRRMMANGAGGREKFYKHSLDCFLQTTKKEGYMALFKGWTPNAVRCIPGASIQFFCYETIKKYLLDHA